MKITEKIFDVSAQQEQVIEREATQEELAAYERAEKEFQWKKAEAETKEAARQAVLTKLGLTPEEAQALLG